MPDLRTPAPSIAEDGRPAWTAPRFPLDCGLVGALRAVPHRIEVTGHAPVWTVSASSVAEALAYATARFGDPHVIGSRARRGLLGRRVSMRVTTDPDLLPSPDLAERTGPTPDTAEDAAASDDSDVEAEPAGGSARPTSFLDHLLASEARLSNPDHVSLTADAVELDPADAAASPVDLVLGRMDDDVVLPAPTLLPVPAVRAPDAHETSGHGDRADDYGSDYGDDVADDDYVAPPVLPPFPATTDDRLWDRGRLAQLGVSAQALEAMLALPGSATMTWPDRVRALVEQRADTSTDPLGGAAVVGYGPAGAAAVLSAVAAGVEAGGLRTEAGSRLLPVTGSRVVTLLERGLSAVVGS